MRDVRDVNICSVSKSAQKGLKDQGEHAGIIRGKNWIVGIIVCVAWMDKMWSIFCHW